MIVPFYHNGSLAFHLGLQSRENGRWNILTNIPRQILDSNNWAISKLTLEQSLLKRTKNAYLEKVAEIIMNDERSHFFFYSNFIDIPEIEVRKSFSEITYSKSNLIMLTDKVYSGYNEPVRFYVLCSLYTSVRIFESCFFKQNVPSIERQMFEGAILNIESQLLYVDFYEKSNEFRFIDDGQFNIFFLLKEQVPKMIIVKHI